MNWSAWEVFSVISGIVLLGACALPGQKAKDRLSMVLGGIALIGYGFFVASQTSGTFSYPVIIFIIPFAAVGYAGYKAYKWQTENAREQQRSHE